MTLNTFNNTPQPKKNTRARAFKAMRQVSMCGAVVVGLCWYVREHGLETFKSAPPPIAPLLQQRILEPKQTDGELRNYCQKRLLGMPQVSSVAEWESVAAKLRTEVLDKVIFRDDTVRKWRDAPTKVEWLETIPGGPGYHIRKLRYEVVPDMWVPAALYMPDDVKGKIPVHLAVNGHDSEGKASTFKQMRCINLAKRGVASLNVEWFGSGQLMSEGFGHYNIKHWDLLGMGGLAPFYLALSRALDIITTLPEADPKMVAVSGLSGGGWQTIVISSLDKRVAAANSVAGYSTYKTRVFNPADIGDAEQVPTDFGVVADYSHLTAMMAGRNLLLTYNAKDNCCFRADYAPQPLLDAAEPIFKLYGTSPIRVHVNQVPGTHNFEVDNREALYRFIGDVFFPGDKNYSAKEIPSESEIKTRQALDAEIPRGNLSLYRVALRQMEVMPPPPPPTRERLKAVTKYEPLTLSVNKSSEQVVDGVRVVFWNLRSNAEWEIPVAEFAPAKPKGTTIVIGDKGRQALNQEVEGLLSKGQRVLAVDLLGHGESEVGNRHRPAILLISSMGGRVVGVQSGQLIGVAHWAKTQFGGVPSIVTYGPRTSFVGMVAKAIEPSSLAETEYVGRLETLKDILYKRLNYLDYPEMFCFGFLKEFDIPQLQALASQ